MRLSLKSLLWSWVLLVIIILGFLIKTYFTFNSESVAAILSEKISQAVPGAVLSVGEINYNFSINLNVKFRNVNIKKRAQLLASVGEIEFKVPWWFVLIREGQAHINLKDVDVFVDGDDGLFKKKLIVKKTSVKPSQSGQPQASHSIGLEIPSDFLNVRYTLRVFNMKVHQKNSSRRYIEVSKLLIRDFQFEENSAFEMNIPFVFTYKSQSYPGNLWLFGDVTPSPQLWMINFRGEFKSMMDTEKLDHFHFDDFLIAVEAKFDPQKSSLNAELSLALDKKPIGHGQLEVKKDLLSLQTSLTSVPLDKLGILTAEFQNDFLIRPSTSAEGSFYFNKDLKTSSSEIKGELSFEGPFFYTEEKSIQGEWKVVLLDEQRLDVTFISPRGEITYLKKLLLESPSPDLSTTNLVVDEQTEKTEENSLSLRHFSEDIKFEGLDVAEVFSSSKYQWSLFHFLKKNPAQIFTTSLEIKDCFLGNDNISGSFKWGRQPQKTFIQGFLGEKKSQMSFSLLDEEKEQQIEMKLSDFVWNSSYQFFNPYLTMETGGVLNGRIRLRNSFSDEKWDINFSGKKIANLKGNVFQLVKTDFEQLSLQKKVQSLALENFFLLENENSKMFLDQFDFKIFLDKEKLQLNPVLFQQSRKNSLKISGKVLKNRKSNFEWISNHQGKIYKMKQNVDEDFIDKLRMIGEQNEQQ